VLSPRTVRHLERVTASLRRTRDELAALDAEAEAAGDMLEDASVAHAVRENAETSRELGRMRAAQQRRRRLRADLVSRVGALEAERDRLLDESS